MFPFTSKNSPGIVLPIPTRLFKSSTKIKEVELNSPELLYKTSPSFPGANTVIVEIEPEAVAVTALPLKSILDTLFAVPTNTLSSKILIPSTISAGVSANQ